MLFDVWYKLNLMKTTKPTTMKFHTLITFLLCLTLMLSSCDEEKDDDQNSPAPVSQETYFNVTFDGTSYSDSDPVVMTEGESIEIVSSYSGSAAAEMGFSEPLGEGTYGTNTERAFVFTDGTDVWFSGTGCTIEITEFDIDAKFMKGKITGTMQDLFGTSTATLTEARFAFSYDQ